MSLAPPNPSVGSAMPASPPHTTALHAVQLQPCNRVHGARAAGRPTCPDGCVQSILPLHPALPCVQAPLAPSAIQGCAPQHSSSCMQWHSGDAAHGVGWGCGSAAALHCMQPTLRGPVRRRQTFLCGRSSFTMDGRTWAPRTASRELAAAACPITRRACAAGWVARACTIAVCVRCGMHGRHRGRWRGVHAAQATGPRPEAS